MFHVYISRKKKKKKEKKNEHKSARFRFVNTNRRILNIELLFHFLFSFMGIVTLYAATIKPMLVKFILNLYSFHGRKFNVS